MHTSLLTSGRMPLVWWQAMAAQLGTHPCPKCHGGTARGRVHTCKVGWSLGMVCPLCGWEQHRYIWPAGGVVQEVLVGVSP